MRKSGIQPPNPTSKVHTLAHRAILLPRRIGVSMKWSGVTPSLGSQGVGITELPPQLHTIQLPDLYLPSIKILYDSLYGQLVNPIKYHLHS